MACAAVLILTHKTKKREEAVRAKIVELMLSKGYSLEMAGEMAMPLTAGMGLLARARTACIRRNREVPGACPCLYRLPSLIKETLCARRL